MDKKGILTIISGFSGSGKGTVVKSLIEKYDYSLSISATTRNKRDGEVDKVNYFFLTEDEFQDMIKKDKFLEWAGYVGKHYGTPKDYVMEQLNLGKDVILEIEYQGALKIKDKFPEAILIFLTAPNIEELKRRLINRKTETKDVIEKRLTQAIVESQNIEKYDYIIVNDKVEECVETINNLIQIEHKKTFRNIEFIDDLKKQLKV